MVTHKAIRCRAYPNVDQQHKIAATIGSCRFVYNHMLSRNEKAHYRRGGGKSSLWRVSILAR